MPKVPHTQNCPIAAIGRPRTWYKLIRVCMYLFNKYLLSSFYMPLNKQTSKTKQMVSAIEKNKSWFRDTASKGGGRYILYRTLGEGLSERWYLHRLADT